MRRIRRRIDQHSAARVRKGNRLGWLTQSRVKLAFGSSNPLFGATLVQWLCVTNGAAANVNSRPDHDREE